MKNIVYIIWASLLFVAAGCEDLDVNRPKKIGAKPAQLLNIQSTPKAGGAVITFDYPNSEDVMYAKAIYSLADGRQWEKKTSLYNNVLEVEGFATGGEQKVTLYAVAKGEVESDPLNITITVNTPPYLQAFESLVMDGTFGGVKLLYTNESKTELAYYILEKDEKGVLKEAAIHRSAKQSGVTALRGREPVPADFGAYTKDRWGNSSDTLVGRFTPIKEVFLDGKNKFTDAALPTDNNEGHSWSGLAARNVPFLFNKVKNDANDCFHTKTTNPEMPTYFTFDMRKKNMISRVKIYQRSGHEFSQASVKSFEIYGSNDPNPDGALDDSWTLLGAFTQTKPSGDGPQITADDKAFVQKGLEFELENNEPFRFIRFRTMETWGGLLYLHIGELELFGLEYTEEN